MPGSVKSTLHRSSYTADVIPVACPAQHRMRVGEKPFCALLRPDGRVGVCRFAYGFEQRQVPGYERVSITVLLERRSGGWAEEVEATQTLCQLGRSEDTPVGADLH